MATKNLGKIAFLYRGDYFSGTTYQKNDVVFDGESSYISFVNNNTGNSLTDINYWKYLSRGNYLAEQQNADNIAQLETDLNKKISTYSENSNTKDLYYYTTDDNINKSGLITYIRLSNPVKAQEDGIYLWVIQPQYQAVYFKDKNGDSFLDSSSRMEDYGLKIKVNYSLGSTTVISSTDKYNLSRRCIYDYINHSLNILNSPYYIIEQQFNSVIKSIKILNKKLVQEDGIYLWVIQPQYQAVYFKDKDGVSFLSTSSRAVDVYKISIAVDFTIQQSSIISQYDSTNFTELCYNNDIGINLGKKGLAIGDSLTFPNVWQQRVAEILGMNFNTHAKGGIGMVAMVDGDGSGFSPISSSDVEDVDCIIIHGLYNEKSTAVSTPGNVNDLYPNNNTFLGKLNYVIKRIYDTLIIANNSKAKIYLSSPHRYGAYPYSLLTSYDDGDAITSLIKQAAEYNSIKFIDCQHCANINKFNWSAFQSSPTNYNPKYIPYGGIYDATNRPFQTINDLPPASENLGYVCTVQTGGYYVSDGISWVQGTGIPYPWIGDQLHLNTDGLIRMGEYIASQI